MRKIVTREMIMTMNDALIITGLTGIIYMFKGSISAILKKIVFQKDEDEGINDLLKELEDMKVSPKRKKTKQIKAEVRHSDKDIALYKDYPELARLMATLYKLGLCGEAQQPIDSPYARGIIYRIKPNANSVAANFTTQQTIKEIAIALRGDEKEIDVNIKGGLINIDAKKPSSMIKKLITINYDSIKEIKDNKGDSISIPLGLDHYGKPIMLNFGTDHHVLIGGETGGGKSTIINTIICGLIERYTPDELRFILIDPKMLELYPYSDTPHLLAPVTADPDIIKKYCDWIGCEVHRRNAIMQGNYKNISNMPQKERFYRIVVVIDEMAQLKNLGTSIKGLLVASSMGRACGIHILCATQEPKAKQLGDTLQNLKANLTARIALRCADHTASASIISAPDAKRLHGAGDAIIKSSIYSLIRFQGANIDENTIDAIVCDSIKRYGQAKFIAALSESDDSVVTADDSDLDKAIKCCLDNADTGISRVLLRQACGFTDRRARELLDELTGLGVISAGQRGKKRKVFVDKIELMS